MSNSVTLFTIRQACEWASNYFNRNITPSNVSYLIQYGRIRKIGNNNNTRVFKEDLLKYYNSYYGKKEISWKKELGDDLNWTLSFDQYSEKERTKHVHRLHPYKGKFIPQLVEYFLDDHTDEFKKETYFHKGDIVLDPFCGSGTTLIQANELGMHAIGIDISAFNAQISNVKLGKYNLYDLKSEINKINNKLAEFVYDSNSVKFEQELLEELNKFNNKHFPTPGFRYKVGKKEINEWKFSKEKEKEFLEIFNKLVKKYKLEIHQNKYDSFLDKWYLKPVREEIDFVLNLVKKIETPNTKKVIEVILSRTIRSCRATTHSDLATLMKPISSTYYCHKHYKICKPLFSINGWWKRYSEDTIVRLAAFNRIRTETSQNCLTGDSRTIDIFEELEKENQEFAILTRKQKIKGIFSSPPYVGLIDYHEQHAYAYDLFKYERQDDLEIGPLCKGKGKEARESYIESISKVLINCKQYLADNYDVFLIANDKFNMYPNIAEKAGLKIVNKFKRPVLNRTEKDKAAYSEIIFHMKEK